MLLLNLALLCLTLHSNLQTVSQAPASLQAAVLQLRDA